MDITEKLQNKMSVQKNFTHITYEEKIKRAFHELYDTDHKKVMRW